jgi:hypothetical protein
VDIGVGDDPVVALGTIDEQIDGLVRLAIAGCGRGWRPLVVGEVRI